MRREQGLALALAVGALVLTAPSLVEACSCRRFPTPGRLHLGAGNTLPADARGIPWWGDDRLAPFGGGDGPMKSFERLIDGKWVAVPYTIDSRAFEFIVPEGGLGPLDRFRVTTSVVSVHHKMETTTTEVTIDTAPVALERATLILSSRRKQLVDVLPRQGGGQCSDELDADTVELTIGLPPSLEPYRDYLLTTTLVDGKAYQLPPASHCGLRYRYARRKYTASTTTRLFRTCDGSEGLAAGTHTVAVQVATPDGRSFVTPGQTIELDCANSPPEPSPPPAAATAAPVGPPPVARGCTLVPSTSPWLVAVLLLGARRRRVSAVDVSRTQLRSP